MRLAAASVVACVTLSGCAATAVDWSSANSEADCRAVAKQAVAYANDAIAKGVVSSDLNACVARVTGQPIAETDAKLTLASSSDATTETLSYDAGIVQSCDRGASVFTGGAGYCVAGR